jgi:hypothetical protein
VNDRTFDINLPLFCCISDKFQAMNRQDEELSFAIPKQHLSCFESFLDIIKRLPFYFEDCSLQSVSYLIHLFGFSRLSDFISQNLPLPQNLQDALDFLSNRFCESYPNLFNKSIGIVIHRFSKIILEQYLKLSNSVLEQLFQSPQFQIDHEDILFDLIVDLIARDPNRKSLFKIIYFLRVSTIRLINYFSDYSFEEIDFDLFEFIKVKLFCEVFQSNNLPSSRWRNSSTFRAKEQMDENLELFQCPKNKSYTRTLSEF